MNKYTVYDIEQPVHFTGQLIGEATTDDGTRDRWSETKIYRTRAGAYIIHKVGNTRREGERLLHSAQVSDTPKGAIDCLRFFDDDGVMTMRRIDKRALMEAILADDTLADAFHEGINVA